MIKIINNLYIAFCWAPLALFVLGIIYLNTLNGWSAWAAAQIMIIPIIISFVMGFTGIVLITIASKKKILTLQLKIAALLTIIPGLWFIGKLLF